MWKLVWCAISGMLAKQSTKFPQHIYCTQVIKRTDVSGDSDQMTLSRHYSLFHGIINKLPVHEAYSVALVEQTSFYSLNTYEDKLINHINANHVIV